MLTAAFSCEDLHEKLSGDVWCIDESDEPIFQKWLSSALIVEAVAAWQSKPRLGKNSARRRPSRAGQHTMAKLKLPSGKHTKNYGKSQFLMGKST